MQTGNIDITDMTVCIRTYLNKSGYGDNWRMVKDDDSTGNMRTQITYWNRFGVIFPQIHRFCIIGSVSRGGIEWPAVRPPAMIYLLDAYGKESERESVVSVAALIEYLTIHFPAVSVASDPLNYMEECVDICVDDVSISQFVSSIASNLQLTKLNSRDNSDLQAVVMQRVSSKVRDALNDML